MDALENHVDSLHEESLADLGIPHLLEFSKGIPQNFADLVIDEDSNIEYDDSGSDEEFKKSC